ncbi:MAG: Lrp/AsnC family transcriptional regulator [Actinomycetia bacterium]|nr:Lrp/AsnC family transcriptional regulator [Actinomycetes bacterium]
MIDIALDSPAMDDLDHVILGELRSEGRLTWRDLGERIGLSATATADRVRRLETSGVIRGYSAEIDLATLGVGLRAITEIRLSRSVDPGPFERMLAAAPEVQSAMHVTGSHDYVLMLACADVPTLDRLLMQWRDSGGVEESQTRIILREIDLTGDEPT